MKKFVRVGFCAALMCALQCAESLAQPRPFQTTFEASGGDSSATYAQCIAFYKSLDLAYPSITVRTMDTTDAGLPLHVALYQKSGVFDTAAWRRKGRMVILIINGIHAGEPDGVDASMMFLRDCAAGKIDVPEGIVLAAIPVYNIGGFLNRGRASRANQDGPAQYGFRGNSQNLDLNRDFTKCDSREARAFARIFHWLDPHILLDTHVSDGADYQHVMTLLSTQYNKLGTAQGALMRNTLDPALYADMAAQKLPLIPYVNNWDDHPEQGWTAFYDPPRFASGYAALWQCLTWVSETHMLKPFPNRVLATYWLMKSLLKTAAREQATIIAARNDARRTLAGAPVLPLAWQPDTTRFSRYWFLGYRAAQKPSEVTGKPRLYYDHSRPFADSIRIYDYYRPTDSVALPVAYVLPGAWQHVAERLQDNGVTMQRLTRDTTMRLHAYRIAAYETYNKPYEGHYKHHHVRVTKQRESIVLHTGDWLIPTAQPARRFLAEMLEPQADDSYFSWNFFDAILQRKEGYSDYRWEDVAGSLLQSDAALRKAFEDARAGDTALQNSAAAQLQWVYDHSEYLEPEYLRYPVYRVE